jgi:hypothetical protein
LDVTEADLSIMTVEPALTGINPTSLSALKSFRLLKLMQVYLNA